jgi:hypothetical protein
MCFWAKAEVRQNPKISCLGRDYSDLVSDSGFCYQTLSRVAKWWMEQGLGLCRWKTCKLVYQASV